MNQEIPSWMDINFLTTILEEGKQKLKVLKFDAKSAVGPGDNFTSKILRVQVDYLVEDLDEEKSVCLIVKEPIGEGLFSKISEKANFYKKEPKVYCELLPFIFKKIKQNLGPKSYISPVKDVIVMQDLKEEGFVVSKGLKQLDYEHCKKVMHTIAQFHACSVSCYKENIGSMDFIGKEALWVQGMVVEKWLKTSPKIVLDIAKKINGDQRFIHFISSRLDNLFEGVVKVNQPKETGLNVLNHGDLWMSNVMFKYDNSGKVLEVKLVDFQILKWASPVADLIYFLWTSANEDVRQNRLMDLFREYLTTLNATFEQIGCSERLSWEELKKDLLSAKDWGLTIICLCLPLMISAPEDLLDFSNFTENDFESEKFKSFYQSKNYLSILPTLLRNYSDFFLNT